MEREETSERRPAQPPAVSDDELMAALVRGERDALGTLYDRHAGVLLAVAIRLLGSRAQAEELLHDIFLEAWHHARDFDPARGSVRAWLLTRTRSRALDGRAAQSRHAKLAQRATVESGLAAPSPVQGSSVDARRVQRGLGRLAAELVAVVELAYFEGLSSSEIAVALEIPIGTVKSRMARALTALREDLGITEKGTP